MEIKSMWKLLWQQTKICAIMAIIGVLLNKAGYSLSDWQFWLSVFSAIILIEVSNRTYHKQQMEKYSEY